MGSVASGAKRIIERALVAERLVGVFEDNSNVVEYINAVGREGGETREADAYTGLVDEIDSIPHFLNDENGVAEEAPAEAVGRFPAENGTLHCGENRRQGSGGGLGH